MDNIALKALQKLPEHRYPSVEALSLDLRRHMEGRPIQARGNERWYRLRRFVARNRLPVALSAGIQYMVRSDIGASGVMFTLDTDSGFRDVVFITASWGLGETVVQGAVNPDEFYVHKPLLAAGRFPVIRRVLGSKLQRMGFASAEDRAASGRLVQGGAA